MLSRHGVYVARALAVVSIGVVAGAAGAAGVAGLARAADSVRPASDWITTGTDCKVYAAGDVDGDGFADLLQNGRTAAGTVTARAGPSRCTPRAGGRARDRN